MPTSALTTDSQLSGIGIRVSFYLQSLLLSSLSIRSAWSNEMTGSLYLSVLMNTSMCVATLTLGFKRQASLYDAMVSCYLLTKAALSVLAALPQYNRFRFADRKLKALAIAQLYVVSATVIAICIKAPSFGRDPSVNHRVQGAIFGPVNGMSVIRLLGLAVHAILLVLYTMLMIFDWRSMHPPGYFFTRVRKLRTNHPQQFTIHRSPESRAYGIPENSFDKDSLSADDISYFGIGGTGRSLTTWVVIAFKLCTHLLPSSTGLRRPRRTAQGQLAIDVAVLSIFWPMFVINTELLHVYNHVESDSVGWGIGDILPWILIFLPLRHAVRVWSAYRLTSQKNRETRVRRLRPGGDYHLWQVNRAESSPKGTVAGHTLTTPGRVALRPAAASDVFEMNDESCRMPGEPRRLLDPHEISEISVA